MVLQLELYTRARKQYQAELRKELRQLEGELAKVHDEISYYVNELARLNENKKSKLCQVDLEGTWSWSWGHGDQELGRRDTTISTGSAEFSRGARRGQPADGTMTQAGNQGVWKCVGATVIFEWQHSVDTLNVTDVNHLNGHGKPDDSTNEDWVRVTRKP